MKIIIFIVLAFSLNPLSGQISVTPYVGLNWTKFVDSDNDKNYKYEEIFSSNLPDIGVKLERQLHDHGFIGTTLAYRLSKMSRNLKDGIMRSFTRFEYELNYFDLGMTYNLIVVRNLYLTTGFTFSYLFNEDIQGLFMGQLMEIEDSNNFPKRDFGITLGTGYRIKKLDIGIKFYFGLSSLHYNGKARVLQFNVGYRIIN
jgi:hypothetical protein